MLMKDIDKLFTEKVQEYLAKGYLLNAQTMGGSQGEVAKIDLEKDGQIVRVMIDTFYECDEETRCYLGGLELVVGNALEKVPMHSTGYSTIWSNHLKVLETVKFYKIAEERTYTWFGTKAEAIEASGRHLERYKAKHTDKPVDLTEKAMPVAKKFVCRNYGVKNPSKSTISVQKLNGKYAIIYRDKRYTLH